MRANAVARLLGGSIAIYVVMVTCAGNGHAGPATAPTRSASHGGPGKDQTGPVALSSGNGGVLAMGATTLYSFGVGTVVAVPKAGGTTMTLASGQMGTPPFPSAPAAIAADASNVYWINSGSFSNNYSDGALLRVPARGGAPLTLSSGLPLSRASMAVASMAVDATNVYWTDGGEPTHAVPGGPTGKVMKVAIAGGQPTVLASGQAGPAGIAVDAANVYWVNSISDTVMSVPLAGGTPVTIAAETADRTRVARVYAIAIDSTSVYWTSGGNAGFGAVEKAPIGGGAPVTLASGWEMASVTPHAIGQSPSMGIAVDATSVYWTNVGGWRSGTVMKVDLGGGTATTLAFDQDSPTAIAVDAKSVYWVNRSAVVQLPK